MTNLTVRILALPAALIGCGLLGGCQPEPPPARPEPVSPSAIASTDCAPPPPSASAQAELDGLDPRTPVPLQPMMAWHQKQNMQDHLVAIERVQDGLARSDWAQVEAAARRLGSSPEMQQMCEHMGAGAPGFTALALEFHARADGIGEAARARDEKGVLGATAATLRVCTKCHATYRQELVDAETWTTRTGTVHNPASGPSSATSAPSSHPSSAPSGAADEPPSDRAAPPSDEP